MLSGPARTLRRARALRSKMSLPEVMVWQRLRLRPQGLKFRRQHPAGPYVLDFYCSEARLAVEIDGECHDARFVADRRRDAFLASIAVATCRVLARDVLAGGDAAVEIITGAALARLPLHRRSGGPPPPVGEDLRS